jgi:hypothetical protein
LLHPKNQPFFPWRSFIGELHSGHVSVTSTAGTAFFGGGSGSPNWLRMSPSIGFVLRHVG